MDRLNCYPERPNDTRQDFDEVVSQVPASTLASGLAEALQSDPTPFFGDMASRLFGRHSNLQQTAGLLGQLANAVGPTLPSTIAAGARGRFMHGPSAAAAAQAAAADVAQVSIEQLKVIATAAQQCDPSVLDRVGSYGAQHPPIIKMLGGAVLAIALGQIAPRMKT